GELRGLVASVVASAEIRGAVIAGITNCFCAGAELTEVAALDGTQALNFSALGQSVMRAIERSPKPFVAAISGYCMGGGFDLALACHMRIAAPDAVFAHRGASLGIITGWGGTQRLARAIGPRGASVAREVMLTGREIRAQEAHDLGLLSRIVPAEKLVDEAIALVALHGSRDGLAS
ncbi:MAG TPA: enoyl-CoA hydratase/isomerase family protein, partial [Candidatus Acidoferrum sp.]|nr:enoyl-CoA hydratase/isomerase family protein [Candidatus Acidoferrum sp.]